MREERLLRAMTDIDPQLIQRCAPTPARETAPARPRRGLRAALLAAAMTALLATAAVALSPTLREVLQGALGSFSPYAQDMTDREIACTDQGIEMRVVSALHDGNTIAVYFEARDLTGDRLDERTTTNAQIQWPRGQVEWKQGMLFVAEQIAYDQENRSALYCARFIGDGIPAEGLTLSLYGQVFTPGSHSFEGPIPDEAISRSVLKTETLPGGETVLAPMQNPIVLIDDCLTLSSCGFGTDGLFHLQLRAGAGMTAGLLPTVQSREFVSGQKTYGEVNHYDRLSETRFEREGLAYYDFTFQAAPEDIGDIVIRQLLGSVHKEEIRGQWRLEVPLERQVSATAIDLRRSGTEAAIGPIAQTLHLSPISCTAECIPGKNGALGYPLTLFFSDGSTTPAIPCDSSYYSDTYATNHWSFPRPIEVETLTGVAIGRWYMPIEEGRAGSGHWLSERPR